MLDYRDPKWGLSPGQAAFMEKLEKDALEKNAQEKQNKGRTNNSKPRRKSMRPTLSNTTIDSYLIEDFVYSYFHNNASLPGFIEDVVFEVVEQKKKYLAKESSLRQATREIRKVWSEVTGFPIYCDIKKEELSIVKSMFDDIPKDFA